MMKHASHQFGDWFSGFSRQSEKFSHIGTCIRCNFMPWTKYANHYDYLFHFSFMVENDSYLSDFTVKTAFFSCWNRVFSHANNLTSLWYPSCKGAVKNRVDRVAAPYLEVWKQVCMVFQRCSNGGKQFLLLRFHL